MINCVRGFGILFGFSTDATVAASVKTQLDGSV
jgi:hypothetical protein